jgi:hypothetical protein
MQPMAAGGCRPKADRYSRPLSGQERTFAYWSLNRSANRQLRANRHMNRSSVRFVVTALALSVVVGFVVKSCSSPELVETFGEKSEWSTLQAIEFQTRDTPLSEPVVRLVAEREVLGVKGASGENVWILLRTEAPPFYKQMPKGQYDLPITLVEKLQHERRLSYTVDAVLRSHVRQK